MTVDVSRMMTLGDAAKLLQGRGNKRPCLETMRRWANPKRGCRVAGNTVILCTVRVGRDLLTMKEWVEAFDAARIKAGIRAEIPEAALPRSPAKRKAAHRRAERVLDAAGIGRTGTEG